MSWGSTVPAALAGLVTAFTTALPNTAVIKGQVVGGSPRTEAVIVAYSTEAEPAVRMQMGEGDAGNRSQQENYSIACQIAVLIGSTDVDRGINRAFELLAAVGESFRTDQTLGIRGTRARLGEWGLSMPQTPKGLAVQIDFAVTVEAFTTR